MKKRNSPLNGLFGRVYLMLALAAGVAPTVSGAEPGVDTATVFRSTFEHHQTGFALTGQHAIEDCVMCHRGGVFAGTPRQCSGCHFQGSGRAHSVKAANHVPTADGCDLCHRSTTVWSDVRLHPNAPIRPGTCVQCHNGSYSSAGAAGKPAAHIMTTAACDQCHNTVQWSAVSFRHSDVMPGSCAGCHNGMQATGKSNNHILTAAACDTCHTTRGWIPAGFNHVGMVTGSCTLCHNGAQATGKPNNHIPTASSCDACHTTRAWQPASFNHGSVVPGSCATCHNSVRATGKAGTHIPTAQSCDACHNTRTFMTSSFRHTAAQGVTPGGCATCHNGSYNGQNALGKPTGHIVTTTACDVCHTTTSWATAGFNHASVIPGTCANCHNGSNATGKSLRHIPTSLSCDACHRISDFTNTTFTHLATQDVVLHQCVTCHNGAYTGQNAFGMGPGHIPTTVARALACDECHSGFNSFQIEPLNHDAIGATIGTGTCLLCHNGAYVSQRALGPHVGVNGAAAGQSCDAAGCHTSTVRFK